MNRWSSLVVEARRTAGLSQRALARTAGVPPSTIHRIESDRMAPTTEMVDRLLAATGVELTIALVPSIDEALRHTDLNESERRSLVLGVLTAQHLMRDPVASLATARRNLETMSHASTAASRPYIDAWRALLNGSTIEVLAVLYGVDERAKELRQATPFAGVVPESERRAALRRLRAA